LRAILAAIAATSILAGVARAADSPSAYGSGVPGGGLFMSGARLAEICDGKIGSGLPNTFAGGACFGYINGVAEMWMFQGAICYNRLTRGEISDAVVKYMNDHPEEIGRHAAPVLIGIALKFRYPVSDECRRQIGAPPSKAISPSN
jgi:hypothetical protein